MTTTIPPAPQHDAAPQWETATLRDLLAWSALTGVPACGLYRAVQQSIGRDVERACDCRER